MVSVTDTERQATRVRVLVTGVGGNVGQGILKALAASGLDAFVVGTDAEPASVGLFLVDRGYVVPRADAPDFEEAFCAILQREAVQIVLVGADTEIPHLARMREGIEVKTGARVVVSASSVVDRCHDKWETARWFFAHGFSHPRTVLADDREGIERLASRHGFPLLVKPRIGYASRGIWLLESEEDIAFCVSRYGAQSVVQERVGAEDEEFTAATFSSVPGRVEALLVMRRGLLQGTSYRIEPVRDATLEDTIRCWAEVMGGTGPLNFQFRRVGGEPVCFEVNPRFSGTVGVRFRFGYNDPAMAVRSFLLGEAVSQPDISPGVVLRYWEEFLISTLRGGDLRRLAMVRDGLPIFGG